MEDAAHRDGLVVAIALQVEGGEAQGCAEQDDPSERDEVRRPLGPPLGLVQKRGYGVTTPGDGDGGGCGGAGA